MKKVGNRHMYPLGFNRIIDSFRWMRKKADAPADVTTEAPKEVIKLRLAGQDPQGHPNYDRLMLIKDTVEKGSDGRVQITIYPANQLGDYTQVYEEIMRGTIDAGMINIPSQYDSKLEIQFAPYMAESYDKAKELVQMDSFLGQELTKLEAAQGVKLLGFSLGGFVGISSTKELTDPKIPGAKKGILLRIPAMDLYKIAMTDMGYNTVTIPYAELFTALQTGVADGAVGTNPVDTYNTIKDVIKYYYRSNIGIDYQTIVINDAKFNTLTPEDQKLFTDVCAVISAESVEAAQAQDELYLGKMKEAGIQIIEYTPEELKANAEFMQQKIWPKFEGRLGKELIAEMQAGLK